MNSMEQLVVFWDYVRRALASIRVVFERRTDETNRPAARRLVRSRRRALR